MQKLALVFSLLTMSNVVLASGPIVFVSAFKPGVEGAIHAYHFDVTTGRLELLHRTKDIENPFFLTISPSGEFLYAIDCEQFGGTDNEFVAAYAVNQRDGQLTRLNHQSARGTASCYLDVDATGKTVVVANYSTGSVASLPVQADGSLGQASAFMQHRGSSVDPKRQLGPNAHCIVVSPDNRFALAADLGIDKIMLYRLNAETANLVTNETQPFAILPPGSGPRHLTFHPSGQYVYVINELNNTITLFDYGVAAGTLTARQTIPTLPTEFSGTSNTADLKITPDGKFLYGTNRGHDSIAIYRIAENGGLELQRIEPSLGQGPQNLLITPDGRWLLCANMPGNNLIVFAIDADTGDLTPTGDVVSISMPSCIRWLSQESASPP